MRIRERAVSLSAADGVAPCAQALGATAVQPSAPQTSSARATDACRRRLEAILLVASGGSVGVDFGVHFVAVGVGRVPPPAGVPTGCGGLAATELSAGSALPSAEAAAVADDAAVSADGASAAAVSSVSAAAGASSADSVVGSSGSLPMLR